MTLGREHPLSNNLQYQPHGNMLRTLLYFLVSCPFPHSLVVEGLRLKATLVTQGFPADIRHSPKKKNKESVFEKKAVVDRDVKKHSSLEECPCISVAGNTNRVTGVPPLPALQPPNGAKTANGAQMQACCSTTGAACTFSLHTSCNNYFKCLGEKTGLD